MGFVHPLKLRRSETRQRAVSLTPRTPYPTLTTSQTETTPPKGPYPHLSKLRLLSCGYVSSDTSGWTVTLRGRPSYVAASTVAASTPFAKNCGCVHSFSSNTSGSRPYRTPVVRRSPVAASTLPTAASVFPQQLVSIGHFCQLCHVENHLHLEKSIETQRKRRNPLARIGSLSVLVGSFSVVF